MTNGLRLFSDVARAGVDPKPYLEPEFRYLDRSARAPAERIRDVLESWFSHYPEEHKREFRSRLQSNDDVQFESSVFELYLRELLLRSGYSVEVHRRADSERSRRPDFYVTRGDEQGVYIEAATATGVSDEERGAINRMNVVYDAINRLASPDFFLWLDVRELPVRPLPARRLRRLLEEWLAGLDYEALCETYRLRDLEGMPRWVFSHAGWRIEFTPYPKAADRRGRQGVRPIGVTYSGLQPDNTQEVIRERIIRKGSRYGRLCAPYIVAVNSSILGTGSDHWGDALFGSPQITITCDPVEIPDQNQRRALDGVWGTEQNQHHARISAVLAVSRLTAWSLATPTPMLYLNPWGEYPLTGPIGGLPTASFENGELSYSEGIHPRTLLGLPEGWPEAGISD